MGLVNPSPFCTLLLVYRFGNTPVIFCKQTAIVLRVPLHTSVFGR